MVLVMFFAGAWGYLRLLRPGTGGQRTSHSPGYFRIADCQGREAGAAAGTQFFP
jgi:hypothetical protein